MNNYRIVRHFASGQKRTILDRLSLEEARAHCKDPNSSSKTCTDKVGKARTRKSGPWFDAYTDK